MLAVLYLTLPLLLVDMPPLLDYPNHLARWWLLAGGASDPALARYYAPSWGIIPNLAFDLTVPPLMRLMPVDLAGRAALAASALLPLAGTLAYHRQAFGRGSLWPFGALLVASGGAFLLGFMNFCAGLGLALMAASWWRSNGKSRPALSAAVLGAFGVALFACHLAGLLFLAVLVASDEAEDFLTRGFADGWARAAAGRAAVVTAGFLPAAVLCAVSPIAAVSVANVRAGMAETVLLMVGPIRGYNAGLDLAAAGVALAASLVCWREGWGRWPVRARIATALLVAMALAAPERQNGAGFFDMRFACMAWLMLFAGFSPAGAPKVPGCGASLVFAVLMAARLGALCTAWSAHADDLAQLRTAISPVRPGDKVLVARVEEDAAPGWWATAPSSRRLPGLHAEDLNVGGLLVLERHAFWPNLFAIPSQQPIRVLPPFDALEIPQLGPVDERMLGVGAAERRAVAAAPCLEHWETSFDWVLLLDAGGDPAADRLLPGKLQPVRLSSFAALYRIRR
jgi:hypothetical protein